VLDQLVQIVAHPRFNNAAQHLHCCLGAALHGSDNDGLSEPSVVANVDDWLAAHTLTTCVITIDVCKPNDGNNDDDDDSAKSHTLNISPLRIAIVAATDAAAFYAVQTLLQLVYAAPPLDGAASSVRSLATRVSSSTTPWSPLSASDTDNGAADINDAADAAAAAAADDDDDNKDDDNKKDALSFTPLLISPRRLPVHLACCGIVDAPVHAHRGVLLDVARHMFRVKDIANLIATMATLKLNTLHLHLTDDQGWRLPVPLLPRLATVAARRAETPRYAGRDAAAGDGTVYGGVYSFAELKALVAFAATLHIAVIPEIDLPGHCTAAIAAYPWLATDGNDDNDFVGDDGGDDRGGVGSGGVGGVATTPQVATRWGIHTAVLQPSERVFAFLDTVFETVCDIFPSPIVHIGGDEVDTKQWRASKQARSVMRRLRLQRNNNSNTNAATAAAVAADDDDKIDDAFGDDDLKGLQRYFLARVQQLLWRRGRRCAVWDEACDGGLAFDFDTHCRVSSSSASSLSSSSVSSSVSCDGGLAYEFDTHCRVSPTTNANGDAIYTDHVSQPSSSSLSSSSASSTSSSSSMSSSSSPPLPLVFAWRGDAHAAAAAAAGADVVASSCSALYFDHYQFSPSKTKNNNGNNNNSNNRNNSNNSNNNINQRDGGGGSSGGVVGNGVEYECIHGFTPLRNVFLYEPASAVAAADAARLTGVQCQLWTEFIHSTHKLHYQVGSITLASVNHCSRAVATNTHPLFLAVATNTHPLFLAVATNTRPLILAVATNTRPLFLAVATNTHPLFLAVANNTHFFFLLSFRALPGFSAAFCSCGHCMG
jgi:N-acetyl-beta-hexosaminidase